MSKTVLRPDRDGSWRRYWISGGGVVKSRVMTVIGDVVTDMRKCETKPLRWFDDKEGLWVFIQGVKG